ncbi:MAG: hypothetical protein EXR85_04930 [Xanthomonadales bacterium]|nr:hypothetical protein [Xanthomonadales bacterium]
MAQIASQNVQNDSLTSLQARVESDPNDGAAWLAIARILARSPPGPSLRHAIGRSIELLPDDYQAWLMAGLEMQQSRGAVAALQWLHHISQQRPELVAPPLAAAQLQSADQTATAAKSFLSIIQDFPADARAHLLYAELLQKQGELHAAGDQLQLALNLKPEIAQNWTALAMLRLATGRYQEAVMAANSALDIGPGEGPARMARAEAYRLAARWKPAMDDYRELLRTKPDNPFILMGIGCCLAGAGDFAGALVQLEKVLQIKPDFFEARLNVALVLASQAKNSEALDYLATLLQQGQLPAPLRDQALVARAALLEQQRLPAYLHGTPETHNLEELQAALRQAPEILLQPDQRVEDSLRVMALASQGANLQLSDPGCRFEKRHAAFVEACVLSRAADTVADMVKLWHDLQQPGTDFSGLDHTARELRETWSAVSVRQRLCAAQVNKGCGEAWLRYWHARLFRQSAACFPGLFKCAPNNIGLHETTAPQQVIRSVRFLLDELYPSLPAGLSRAAFMLVAMCRIHGFVDGNGRVARFLFGWELECAGLPPALWTPDLLKKGLVHCQDQALYSNSFEAFQPVLQQAQSQTETLLRDFSERLAQS